MKNINENLNPNTTDELNNQFKTSLVIMREILCVYLPLTADTPVAFEDIQELVYFAPEEFVINKFKEILHELNFDMLTRIHNDKDYFEEKYSRCFYYFMEVPEYTHFSIYHIYEKFGYDRYLDLRSDYLNLVKQLYAESTSGKVIEKEVIYENFIVTKFIDDTYRVFDVSNNDKVRLVEDIHKTELDRMLLF